MLGCVLLRRAVLCGAEWHVRVAGVVHGTSWELEKVRGNAVMAMLTLAIISVVAALQVFGKDRLVFWRESESGMLPLHPPAATLLPSCCPPAALLVSPAPLPASVLLPPGLPCCPPCCPPAAPRAMSCSLLPPAAPCTSKYVYDMQNSP